LDVLDCEIVLCGVLDLFLCKNDLGGVMDNLDALDGPLLCLECCREKAALDRDRGSPPLDKMKSRNASMYLLGRVTLSLSKSLPFLITFG
jgi:hypothetical protein